MARKLIYAEEFSCRICSKAYDESDHVPKALRCLHVFCQSCLEKWSQDDVISCSVCQDKTKLGSTGVQGLFCDPSQLRMKQLAEISKQTGSIPCHDCPDKATAGYFCKNCNDFLCQSCRDHHLSQRSKYTKDHAVIGTSMVSPDVLRSATKQQKCSEHDQPLVFYCSSSDCKVTICAACTVFDHKEQNGHKIGKLADACQNAEKQLEKLGAITKDHSSKIDNSIKTEEVNRLKLEKQKEVAMREIDEEFHKLSKAIKTRRDALMKDAEREFANMKEESTRRTNELKAAKEKRLAALGFKDRIKHHTSENECMALSNVMQQRFDLLNKEGAGKQPIAGFVLDYKQKLSDEVAKCLLNTKNSIESRTLKICSSDVTTSGAVENTRSEIAKVLLKNQQGVAEMVDCRHVEASATDEKGQKTVCEIEQNSSDKLMKIFLTARPSGKYVLKITVFGQLLEDRGYSINVEKEQDSEDEIASSEALTESISGGAACAPGAITCPAFTIDKETAGHTGIVSNYGKSLSCCYPFGTYFGSRGSICFDRLTSGKVYYEVNFSKFTHDLNESFLLTQPSPRRCVYEIGLYREDKIDEAKMMLPPPPPPPPPRPRPLPRPPLPPPARPPPPRIRYGLYREDNIDKAKMSCSPRLELGLYSHDEFFKPVFSPHHFVPISYERELYREGKIDKAVIHLQADSVSLTVSELGMNVWKSGNQLTHKPLTRCNKLGFLLDTQARTWTVVDCNQDTVLAVVSDINLEQPLWPVFGVFELSLQLTLYTGDDIERIPSCINV